MKKIKIKTDYVPKAQRIAKQLSKKKEFDAAKAATSSQVAKKMKQLCPNCNQMIPISELDQHIRIELLDPKWKEQKERELGKKRESNLSLDRGREVAQNLKKFAEVRKDIFGGDTFETKKKIQEQMEKAKLKESIAWDGHAATADRTNERTSVYVTNSEVHQTYMEQMAAVEAQQVGPGIVFQNSMALATTGMNAPVESSGMAQSSYSGAAVHYGDTVADEDGVTGDKRKRQDD